MATSTVVDDIDERVDAVYALVQVDDLEYAAMRLLELARDFARDSDGNMQARELSRQYKSLQKLDDRGVLAQDDYLAQRARLASRIQSLAAAIKQQTRSLATVADDRASSASPSPARPGRAAPECGGRKTAAGVPRNGTKVPLSWSRGSA